MSKKLIKKPTKLEILITVDDYRFENLILEIYD